MVLNSFFRPIRRIIVSAIILSAVNSGSAQEMVNVSFKNSDDPSVISMLRAFDGYQVKATISGGNNDARFYELWLVKNHDDCISKTFYGFVPAATDSTDIVFTSIVSDSLAAFLSTSVTARCAMKLPTASCLLIELVKNEGYAQGDTIPLVAYSTGKPTKYDLGKGNVVEGFDICGVRYSGVHPSQWYARFGIRDCYYIEAVPVKEIDYTKLDSN